MPKRSRLGKKRMFSLKAGDFVKYKDGDPRTFSVYAVYSPTKVSLGLAKYPDVEQDYQVDVKRLRKVKKHA